MENVWELHPSKAQVMRNTSRLCHQPARINSRQPRNHIPLKRTPLFIFNRWPNSCLNLICPQATPHLNAMHGIMGRNLICTGSAVTNFIAVPLWQTSLKTIIMLTWISQHIIVWLNKNFSHKIFPHCHHMLAHNICFNYARAYCLFSYEMSFCTLTLHLRSISTPTIRHVFILLKRPQAHEDINVPVSRMHNKMPGKYWKKKLRYK